MLRLDEVPGDRDRPHVDASEVTSLLHVRAAQAGLVVAEVPSHGRQRRRGVSNLTAIEEGRRVLRAILRERRRARRPVAPGAVETVSSLVPAQRRAPDELGPATAGDVAPQPTVSVIIAAYALQRWDDLRGAVASVQEQTVPVLETIVVIDHQPELLARARRELRGVTVIANQGVPGASAARNTGVAASRGESWRSSMTTRWPRRTGWPRCWATSPIRAWSGWAAGWIPCGRPHGPTGFRPSSTGRRCVLYRDADSPGGRAERLEQQHGHPAAGLRPGPRFRDDMAKVGKRSRPEDTDLCLRATEVCPSGVWMYEPAAAAGHRVRPNAPRSGTSSTAVSTKARGRPRWPR